jgi:hypothetical protein
MSNEFEDKYFECCVEFRTYSKLISQTQNLFIRESK